MKRDAKVRLRPAHTNVQLAARLSVYFARSSRTVRESRMAHFQRGPKIAPTFDLYQPGRLAFVAR